jgi:tRNA 2-thiouridine synthesizing protein A
MKPLATDETLEVLATDPGSVPDFQAFCEATGHQLVESGEDAGVFHFLIRKTA